MKPRSTITPRYRSAALPVGPRSWPATALCGALWSFCAAAPALAEAPAAPRGEPGVLARLTFAADSAALGPANDAAGELGATVRWASGHPDAVIVVDGHADPTGTSARGAWLALARAKAVRAGLVAAGANPEQIVIAAFGGDGRRDRSVVVWGTRALAPR